MHKEDYAYTIKDKQGNVLSLGFCARSEEEALRIAKKVYRTAYSAELRR